MNKPSSPDQESFLEAFHHTFGMIYFSIEDIDTCLQRTSVVSYATPYDFAGDA